VIYLAIEIAIHNNSILPKTIPEKFNSSILEPNIVEKILDSWRKNPMLVPRIVKIVVNISVGGSSERLDKAVKLLNQLTGSKPIIRHAKKTIREFGISRRQPIATVVTLRGSKAYEFLRKALTAINNTIKEESFDNYGNISFGIKEHLLIPGVRYDPDIGIFGMDVAITVERPGYRVLKRRRCRVKSIPKRHRVSKEESMLLMEILFGARIAHKR